MTPGGPPNGHDQRKAYDDVLAHISHKRRKQRASSRRRGRRSVLASMFVVAGIGLGVLLIGTAVGGAVVVDDTLSGVSLDSLQQDPPGVNSRIYAADSAGIRRAYERAMARQVEELAIFTRELFSTPHDEANRAAVAAVPAAELDLVGIALRAERKVVDKVLDRLRPHP